MEDNNYKIYKFTFSDGKIYIGQTKMNLEERWRNGEGYKNQDVYVPITLEGWDNIQKEILHTNLTMEQANKLEKYYIKKYNSIKNGYNRNNGNKNNLINNLGQQALMLTCDSVTTTEKEECSLFILKSLNGRQGNLLKVMWYFMINDNNHILLTKQNIINNLNIPINKYYEARQQLLNLNWIKINIENHTLNICYNNILKFKNSNNI